MVFLLSWKGCGYRLPCLRYGSYYLEVEICNRWTLLSFQVGKNFENRQKLQKRRSAFVRQADFGKLELSNIRKDSGNSQRLSVVNVINLKNDQLEINVAECSPDLRAFVDGRENFYPWPLYGFYKQTNKQTFNCRGRESWNAG